MNTRATQIIESLKLIPHPEGGYYKRIFESEYKVISPVNQQERFVMTDIYYLLAENQFSCFHKVLHDEIWNFYEGSPLKLIEISPDFQEVKTVILGEKNSSKTCYKHIVNGGNRQAATTLGEYSLLGCSVAPGFDFDDFQLLKNNPTETQILQKKYPQLSWLIGNRQSKIVNRQSLASQP